MSRRSSRFVILLLLFPTYCLVSRPDQLLATSLEPIASTAQRETGARYIRAHFTISLPRLPTAVAKGRGGGKNYTVSFPFFLFGLSVKSKDDAHPQVPREHL